MWSTTGEEKKNVCCFDVSSLCENHRKNRVTKESLALRFDVMVDDKDDASREERQQKHKEDFDPPRVRQCVTRSVLPFFSFSRVEEQQQQRTQNAGFLFFLSHDRACLIVSFLFSLSLSLSSRPPDGSIDSGCKSIRKPCES